MRRIMKAEMRSCTASVEDSASSSASSPMGTETQDARAARKLAHRRILSYMMRPDGDGTPSSGLAARAPGGAYASGAYSARARRRLDGMTPHSLLRTPNSARRASASISSPQQHRRCLFVLGDGSCSQSNRPHRPQADDHEIAELSRVPLWQPGALDHAFRQHYLPLEHARRRRIAMEPSVLRPAPLVLPPIEETIWASIRYPRARHDRTLPPAVGSAAHPIRYRPSERLCPAL